MGLREAAETFVNALLENADQSLAMAKKIAGFISDLEEDVTFHEDYDFTEDDPVAWKQPVRSEPLSHPGEDEDMDFTEASIEVLEALAALLGGKFVRADDTGE